MKLKPYKGCAIFAIAFAVNVLLSAYEFPWTTSTISVPSTKTDLQISVRRAHPMLAEYDFKISGKLPDGKEFSVNLQPDTGGQAMRSIEYIPDKKGTGYLLFVNHTTNSNATPKHEYLNLTTGAVEIPEELKSLESQQLGFIGFDMKYHPQSAWALSEARAELALLEHDFKNAHLHASEALDIARKTPDKELIANSYFSLARVSRYDKSVDALTVENYLKKAEEHLTGYEKPRADGIEIVPIYRIWMELSNFYLRNGKTEDAKDWLWKVIVIVKGSHGEKGSPFKMSESERKLFNEELSIQETRIELKQGFKMRAAQIVQAIKSSSLKNDDEMRKSWGELYPNMVVLEYDIWNQLYLNPNGDPLVVSATFEITPKGDIENLKIFPSTGDKNECDALVANGIYAAEASGRTRLPIIDRIHCKLTLDCKPNDFKVAIVPMKN